MNDNTNLMSRLKILNGLILDNNYKSYLEIGTQADVCLGAIKCEYKVGVDPYPVFHDEKNSNRFYQFTSDYFFDVNKDTFDLIFVDGLHHAEQVIKDINNALAILNKSGAIVIHDCNPFDYESQTIPESHMSSWNGDVWKAWMFFRINRADLSMYVIDTDTGCGIIQRGNQEVFKHNEEIKYSNMIKNKKEWLNLIDYDEDL